MAYKGWESYVPPGPIGEDGRVTPAKPSKYRNRKTTVDGITFDSAKEARRWTELLMLQRSRHIHALERQVRYQLFGHDIHRGTKEPVSVYVADFAYCLCEMPEDWCVCERLVVEDVKGCRTDVYRLKKKLMLACYGIEIREV